MHLSPTSPAINQSPGTQLGRTRTILLCFFINLMDGYDILAMAFAAPAASHQWQLTPIALGWLLSAALMGMTVGALVLSHFADILGRRPVILAGLAVIALTMVGAGLTMTPLELGLARFLTGLAVGGIMTSTSALAFESAAEHWRGATMALMAASFPLGALVGGSSAVVLVDVYDWHALFLAGGGVAAVLVAIAVRGLSESPSWIRPAKWAGRQRGNIWRVLKGRQAGHAGRMAAIFFLFMISFYFFQSWLPQLTDGSGTKKAHVSTAPLWLNIGGIFGASLAALLIGRCGSLNLSFLALFGTAAGIALSASPSNRGDLAYLAVTMTGLAMFAGMAGLYTVMLTGFSAEDRASGTGLVLTAGRLGSASGPTLAGVLLAQGFQIEQVFGIMALPVFAALPILLIENRLNTVGKG